MLNFKKQKLFTTSNNFLSGWSSIFNTGQVNDGIYIKKNDPTVIMKCNIISTRQTKISKLMMTHDIVDVVNMINKSCKIFPNVYNIIFHFDVNTSIKSKYTIMERFHGDVSQLLFVKIPEHILNTVDIFKNYKNDIWDLYYNMIPYLHNEYNVGYLSDITIYMYNNRDQLPSLIEKNKSCGYVYEEEDEICMFNGIKIDDIDLIDLSCNLDTLDKLYERFKNSNLTYELYMKFIDLIQFEINKIFNEIKNQIIMLKIRLHELGYAYNDNKLDNFAYILSDNKIDHLNMTWNKNIYLGKYLYIYCIDFDGLIEYDKCINPCKIIKDYNTSLTNYKVCSDTNNMTNLNVPIHEKDNFLNLPTDIHKIITQTTLLKINIPMKNYCDINVVKQEILDYEKIE